MDDIRMPTSHEHDLDETYGQDGFDDVPEAVLAQDLEMFDGPEPEGKPDDGGPFGGGELKPRVRIVRDTRPIGLTRELGHFRLAFDYREDLVKRMHALPYAAFDKPTKSWTVLVSDKAIEGLRAMYYEGLCDVAVDTLVTEQEDIPICLPARLRAGTRRRPYIVIPAWRDDHLYSRLRSIAGAIWEKKIGGLTYPAGAGVALAELVAKGVIDDPDKLLAAADTVVAFDARSGGFAVLGDTRAQIAFEKHFPDKDVVAAWRAKEIDVAFADPLSEEIYRGELVRAAGREVQPDGLKLPLFPYQAQDLAVALERSGLAEYSAPGLGKCLRGDAEVRVNGQEETIEALWESQANNTIWDGEGEWSVPRDALSVQSIDSDRNVVVGAVSRLYRQKVSEHLNVVRLDDGSEVIVTTAHKLYTADGWTNTYAEGDLVGIVRRLRKVIVNFARITSITTVWHEGYVYDLEIAGHHNFVANGILCHNTAIGIALGHELLNNREEVDRVVIVCPGAVRTQWQQEIMRFTGNDDIALVEGSAAKRVAAYEQGATARWLIVHYDVLHRDLKHLMPLAANSLLIADEAHRCLVGDSLIETRERGLLRIQDLVDNKVIADVAAWDETRNRYVYQPITDWMVSERSQPLVRVRHSRGEFTATYDHPVWSWVRDTGRDGYTEAGKLMPGTVLLDSGWANEGKATMSTVVDVALVDGDRLVYNLEVAGTHNYFADGVLVHNCKSITAKRTKALHSLNRAAARRFALTGTPVESVPDEWYWVLSGFAVPGCLGGSNDFLNRYMYPNRWGGFEGARNLPELAARSKVHYVRHTKAQVAKHLPPLRVQHLALDADTTYANALRRAHRDARDEIAAARRKRASKHLTGVLDGEVWDEIEAGAEMTAVGMLRLMCTSPRLVAESESHAAQALVEAGIVPDVDGPKLDELRVLGTEMQNAGERVVIFTFSKRMANLIATRFDEDGTRYVLYTGDTSQKDREAARTRFVDAEDDVTAFISTDAGAEGLNLGRCCSTLVNVDIPWTPTRLEQRSNRIHRIDGTASGYLVINMTVRGTIEDGILRLVENKADIADSLFGETGARGRTTGRTSGRGTWGLAGEVLTGVKPSGGRKRGITPGDDMDVPGYILDAEAPPVDEEWDNGEIMVEEVMTEYLGSFDAEPGTKTTTKLDKTKAKAEKAPVKKPKKTKKRESEAVALTLGI